MHSLSNLKYVGMSDNIEGAVFMIRRNQVIYTRIVYFSKCYIISNAIVMENYKSCFKKSLPFKSSINTSHMSFVIWGFFLALLASHLLLLELGHVGWNCSGHGCLVIFLLAWSTCGERSLTITVSTNQSFYQNNFEIQ